MASAQRQPQAGADRTRRRASLAPVVVVLGGLGLAITLVFIGARLAAAPAPSPDLSRPGTADEPRRVVVVMRDYVFNPSTLHLVPGEVVELYVFNGGLVEHELVLGDGEVQRAWAEAHSRAPTPAPFASPPPVEVGPEVGGLRVLLGPGQSTRLTYEVPGADGLSMVCHLPGHAELGMVGGIELAEGTGDRR